VDAEEDGCSAGIGHTDFRELKRSSQAIRMRLIAQNRDAKASKKENPVEGSQREFLFTQVRQLTGA